MYFHFLFCLLFWFVGANIVNLQEQVEDSKILGISPLSKRVGFISQYSVSFVGESSSLTLITDRRTQVSAELVLKTHGKGSLVYREGSILLATSRTQRLPFGRELRIQLHRLTTLTNDTGFETDISANCTTFSK